MTAKATTFSDLADDALVRQSDIVRDPKRKDRAPLLSISPTTHWRWVQQGKFPKPVKLGGSTFWRVGAIRQWLAEHGAQSAAA